MPKAGRDIMVIAATSMARPSICMRLLRSLGLSFDGFRLSGFGGFG